MRILLTAAIAASLAAGSLSTLAQTAAPAAPAKCKTFKEENSCTGRTDCTWTKPGNTKGKCKTAPKPKTT